MPSSDAIGDWLRRIGAGQDKADGSARLERVNCRGLRRILRRDERTDYTLDIDATQIVAEKRAPETPTLAAEITIGRPRRLPTATAAENPP